MPIAINNTDLMYFPVPKVACTSIKVAVLAVNNPAAVKSVTERDANGKRRDVHRIYNSTTFKVSSVVRFAHRRWFCVVRDPVKRFLSGYTNRLYHHHDLSKTDDAVFTEKGLSRKPELDEFVYRLEDYMAINSGVNHHFRPMVDFLGTKAKRYDRVFRMSELDDLVTYCAGHGATLELPHMQSGGKKLALDVLDQKMRDKLLAFYAADYKAFGRYLD